MRGVELDIHTVDSGILDLAKNLSTSVLCSFVKWKKSIANYLIFNTQGKR